MSNLLIDLRRRDLEEYSDPKIKPEVIAEGRVVEISLNPKLAQSVELLMIDGKIKDDSPVVLTFAGDNDHYLRIFDHRYLPKAEFYAGFMAVTEDYCRAFASNLPCLAGVRKKSGLYVAITDLGTPDMLDGGSRQKYHLLNISDEHAFLYQPIVKRSLHHDTGIMLADEI